MGLFDSFIRPSPPPPAKMGFGQQIATAQADGNKMSQDTSDYIRGFREIRVQTKDQDGNPIIITIMGKFQEDGTDSSDYDFKVSDAGGASGSSGSVVIADGVVQDSDLTNFTSTPSDPVPTKIVYQFPVTGATIGVTDGQTVYLRYTMTTPAYYTYQMNVAAGNAVDIGGTPAAGLYTHGDGKIFNNGAATVDFVALSGTPPDTSTVGHIRLATVHITDGVMTFTNSFPRHIVAPMLIAPTRNSITP